jgi:cytochrome c oxidase subunit 2
MFEGLPLFPEQASTAAAQVDAAYIFLICVSAFFALLISLLIIYFAIKYRRRSEDELPQPVAGSLLLELIWTVIPFLLAMVMFVWGASIFFKLARPPAGAMDVYLVAKRWMWKFQHVTGQREINELHVPVGRAVRLTMASEDVIHSFYVPAFRVKGDVVPGRYRTTWFQATKAGEYRLFCAEYCGTRHAAMGGKIVVMQPGDYEAWLSGGTQAGSMAEAGERLFNELACHTCHKLDASGRGPVLAGIFGSDVKMQSGEVVHVDETYLRESVLNPHARLTAGYPDIMPTFQGQISEEGLLQLIAYIKSLTPASSKAMDTASASKAKPQTGVKQP